MFTIIAKNIMEDTYTVECQPCIVCSNKTCIDVPAQGIFWYNQGKLIQECFPELPKEDRELLITGTHDECFNSLYKEEE